MLASACPWQVIIAKPHIPHAALVTPLRIVNTRQMLAIIAMEFSFSNIHSNSNRMIFLKFPRLQSGYFTSLSFQTTPEGNRLQKDLQGDRKLCFVGHPAAHSSVPMPDILSPGSEVLKKVCGSGISN